MNYISVNVLFIFLSSMFIRLIDASEGEFNASMGKIADTSFNHEQVTQQPSKNPTPGLWPGGVTVQSKSHTKVEKFFNVRVIDGVIQTEQKDPSFFEKAKNYATPMLISAVITGAVTVVNKYLLTSAEERAIMIASQKQQIEINKLAIEQQRQELEARKVIIEEARLKQAAEKKAFLQELIANASTEDRQQLVEKLQKFCKKQAMELMNKHQTDLLLQVKTA